MENDKKLILVVDDDRDFRDVIKEMLTAAGFEVALAINGEEGIKESEELTPSLILMDIKMPGMGGIEAALAIKNNPKTSGIKIAFLTGLDNPWPALIGDKGDIAKELGMEDYIKKTDDAENIIEKIKGFLSV